MAKRYLLGFDVGSSSVKASLVNADSGECAASAFFPERERVQRAGGALLPGKSATRVERGR